MTIKQTIIPLIFIALLLSGCATYSIQTDSLVGQLKQNQRLLFNGFFPKYSYLNYPSNNITKLKCMAKNGNEVWLYPFNATCIFIKKSTGKKLKADFETVIFKNDSLYGLRTRLFGGLKKIAVNDIEKITIRTEKSKVEAVQ